MAKRGKKAKERKAYKKNQPPKGQKKIQKGSYRPQDRFFETAKQKGFRSRSAFKLIEICKKFSVLWPGAMAIDLGCAPGGWLQVISQAVGANGGVIGIDITPVNPFSEKNIQFIQGDIGEEFTRQRLLAALGRKVDTIFSDMAPNLSGIKFQDHFNSYQLALKGLEICRMVLRGGGSFVAKIFPGDELENFKNELKATFQKVSTFIPEATRTTSNEIYLIAKGFQLM